MASKQYSRAILEFRNAIQVVPNDAEPYYQLGIAWMQAGDSFDAFRAFYRATELNPKHWQAQKKVAELLSLAGKERSSSKCWKPGCVQVLFASPDDEEATDALALTEFQLGKSEDATRRLEQSLQKFPSRLKSSVALASLMLAEKHLDGAEKALQNAAAMAPESATAQLALGQLYILLGHPEKAEPDILKAIQLDPKNGPALLSLAQLQIAAKRMDEAEPTLKQLSALPDKEYRDLHAPLLLYVTGKNSGAIFRSSRRSCAKIPLIGRRAADCWRCTCIPIEHRTRKSFSCGLEAKSQRHRRVGSARRALLENFATPQRAEQDFKEVLHLQPDSARAHFGLARASMQTEGLE